MSKSRKNYGVAVDTPKGTWRHEYNGKLRSKSKQLLNQVIDGKIDPDELILPDETTNDFTKDYILDLDAEIHKF